MKWRLTDAIATAQHNVQQLIQIGSRLNVQDYPEGFCILILATASHWLWLDFTELGLVETVLSRVEDLIPRVQIHPSLDNNI
jgi:hypothetical protein